MNIHIRGDGHHAPLNCGGIPPHSHSLTLDNLIWRFNWEHEIRWNILRRIEAWRVQRCANLHSYARTARTETRNIADLRRQKGTRVSLRPLHIHSRFIDGAWFQKKYCRSRGRRSSGAPTPSRCPYMASQQRSNSILVPDWTQSRETVSWNRRVLFQIKTWQQAEKQAEQLVNQLLLLHPSLLLCLAHQWSLGGNVIKDIAENSRWNISLTARREMILTKDEEPHSMDVKRPLNSPQRQTVNFQDNSTSRSHFLHLPLRK